jgi:hypothetical protein
VEHPKDVEMEKAPSNMDYCLDNLNFEHPSATEELEQISASKRPLSYLVVVHIVIGSPPHVIQSKCDH